MKTDQIKTPSRSVADLKQSLRAKGEAEIARAKELANKGAAKGQEGQALHADSVSIGETADQLANTAAKQVSNAAESQASGTVKLEQGIFQALSGQVGQLDALEQIRGGINLQQLAADDKNTSLAETRKGIAKAKKAEKVEKKQIDALEASLQKQNELQARKDSELVALKGGLLTERTAEKEQDASAQEFKKADNLDETGGLLKSIARHQLSKAQAQSSQANALADQATDAGLKSQALQGAAQNHLAQAERLKASADQLGTEAGDLRAQAAQLEAQAAQAEQQAQQLAEQAAMEKQNACQASQYAQKWHQIGHCHIHQGQAMLMCPFTHCAGHHMIYHGQQEIGYSHQWAQKSQAEEAASQEHACQAQHKQSEADKLRAEAARIQQEAAAKQAQSDQDASKSQAVKAQSEQEAAQSVELGQQATLLQAESNQLKEQAGNWQDAGMSFMQHGGQLQQLAFQRQTDALGQFDLSRQTEQLASSQEALALQTIQGALGQESHLHKQDNGRISHFVMARKREDAAIEMQAKGLDHLDQDVAVSREGIAQTQAGVIAFESQSQKEMRGLKLENQGYRLLEEARKLRESAGDNMAQSEQLSEQADLKESQAKKLIADGQSLQAASEVIDAKGQAYVNLSQP
jgi:hypothetical protein